MKYDKPHWVDAARMLEHAARRIRTATTVDDDQRKEYLSDARSNIDAALVRLNDAFDTRYTDDTVSEYEG